MADTKISALTAATTPLAGTEVLPIVQSGVTKQVSVADLTAGRAVSAASLTLTTALTVANGGTGQSSYAVGDLLYASTTTALSKLADVATGNALISGGVGVAPSWGKIGLTTHVSGTLAVTNGGTGLSSVAQGDILYGSAANTLAALAKNTTASRYLSNGGTSNNPSWAQIDLSNGVTGTLPVGNGGTGLTTLTANRIPYGNGTSAFQSSSNLTFDGSTFTVNGTIACTGDNAITASNPTGGTGGLKLTNPSNNTSSKIARFFGWDGSETGSISTYVNVTAYTTSSDSRLKESIGVATDISVVDNLIVRDFRWKANGELDRGLFAQEAVLVKPSAVIKGDDSLTEHGTLAVPWSVDYSKFVPDLIVYCQQLKLMVNQQKAEIEALKQKIGA